MNRILLSVIGLALGSIPLSAAAQQPWRFGLVSAAAYSGTSSTAYNTDLTIRLPDGTWPAGKSFGSRREGAITYHVGLQISKPLTPRLTLELEPRYSRLRSDLEILLGESSDYTVTYGRAVGGLAQLPVGVRWRVTQPKPVTLYLLGRAVLGLARTNTEPLRLESISTDQALVNIGFDGAEAHWQSGLEGGLGLMIRQQVGLNLLFYHGLNVTKLARVSAMVSYSDDPTTYVPRYQRPYYYASGYFQGLLNTVSLQAVAYFN